jgi:hypothetical protein
MQALHSMAKLRVLSLLRETLWLVLYTAVSLCLITLTFHHLSRYFIPVISDRSATALLYT